MEVSNIKCKLKQWISIMEVIYESYMFGSSVAKAIKNKGNG